MNSTTFDSMCSPEPTSGCLLWTGATNNRGYGVVNNNGTAMLAHRFAWLVASGTAPGAMFVLHRCDNPACVNPDHLFLGTQRDNVRDMVTKGRAVQYHGCGESSGRHVLTRSNVDYIRLRYAAGGVTHRELAAMFGVHECTVARAISGQTWNRGDK